MSKGTGAVATVSTAADDLKDKMKDTNAAQVAFRVAQQDYANAEGRLAAAQDAEAEAHETLRRELAARRHVRNAR